MRTASVTFGEITGSKKKVIKQAQAAICLSAWFWVRIKKGYLPYVADSNIRELREANYKETVKGMKDGSVYWIKESHFEETNKIYKQFVDLEELKQVFKSKLDKLKK